MIIIFQNLDEMERKKTEEFYKSVFIEFVEVLIHQIIYLRKIYPESIYESRRKFNIPVKMSKHPWVNNYIEETLETLHKHLLSEVTDFDSVDVIVTNHGLVKERFKLEFAKITFNNVNLAPDTFSSEFELGLASILLRLNSAILDLREENDADREWWVEFGSTIRGAKKLIQDQKWCLAEKHEDEDKSIIPVMMINIPFKLQLYIETIR